jgi:competence protein ComEC
VAVVAGIVGRRRDRVSCFGRSSRLAGLLLPGDIEKKVENELVAENAPLKADFLKVPHHGSKTSSTESFVAAVAPKFAVVSVGDGNQFGHPVDSVVARYAAAGVRFLRTDRDGAVTALTDGRL